MNRLAPYDARIVRVLAELYMRRTDAINLILIAAIWGSSFLFIRMAGSFCWAQHSQRGGWVAKIGEQIACRSRIGTTADAPLRQGSSNVQLQFHACGICVARPLKLLKRLLCWRRLCLFYQRSQAVTPP